jgi:glycosyltransferase involved in cell wall biosynthesis
VRVTFVLPGYTSRPVGGFKVVYEYANRLTDRGHIVTVLHPRHLSPIHDPLQRLKDSAWPYKMRWLDGRLVPWFPTRPAVRLRLVPDPRAIFVPKSDAVVATAWQTAGWVNEYPPSRGDKFYLIQHYETWSGSPQDVDATWRLPMRKLAIARWLCDVGRDLGVADQITYVPNGIDFDQFRLIAPIEDRDPRRVLMLYHWSEWKGVEIGLQALSHVRRAVPDLEVVFFGALPRAASVPEWVTYVERPLGATLTRLYNSCSIFVSPSWSEGWALPAAEALACGCALVTSDSGGVRDYAIDGVSALIAPPKDADALAERVLRVVTDDRLRCRLAHAGHQSIRTFSWTASTDLLEAELRRGRRAPQSEPALTMA